MLMSVYCESVDGSECKTHVVHDSERVREAFSVHQRVERESGSE